MIQVPAAYRAAYAYTEGPNDLAIARLIDWLGVDLREISIVVPQKQNNYDVDLVQGYLRNGALEYGMRVGGRPARGNVLALWVNDAELARIERTRPFQLAVAPWRLEEVEIWRLARDPFEVTQAQVPASAELDGFITAVMQAIAIASNPGNGFASYNKDMVTQAFTRLREVGETWDAIACAAYLARSGWQLDAARKFVVHVTEIANGANKRFTPQFRPDFVDYCREQAALRDDPPSANDQNS